MGKRAKKVTVKEAKKGGAGTMAQTAEKKRVEQEQDELQKQQDQNVDPDENLDDETSQGEDDQDDEEEKTPLIQRIKAGAIKVLKILVKWVLRPLAIAIVVFASMISLIVNLGHSSDQQDEGGDTDSDPDHSEDDAPEEEFDDSDQDGEDQVE